MKNILNQLERTDKSILLELPDDAAGAQFMQEAEAAGFRFADGVRPTQRGYHRIMALHSDRTLCYAGLAGNIAFGCKDPSRLRLRFQNGISQNA